MQVRDLDEIEQDVTDFLLNLAVPVEALLTITPEPLLDFISQLSSVISSIPPSRIFLALFSPSIIIESSSPLSKEKVRCT